MRGLLNGLTEMAVRAAGQIKLIPASLYGRRVSTFIGLEHNFNIL